MSLELITGRTLGSLRNDFAGPLGCKAIAKANITITHLGRYKTPGNTGSQTVRLYDIGGTQLGSVSVNVGAGTDDTDAYTALGTPVDIDYGVEHWVGSIESNGGNQWHNTGAVTSGAGAAVENSAYNDGTWHAANAGQSYIPVNYKYDVRPLANNFAMPIAALAGGSLTGTPWTFDSSAGTATTSAEAAELISLTFLGTGLKIWVQPGSDTTLYPTVDAGSEGSGLTGTNGVWGFIVLGSGLTYGTHTIKVRKSGTSPFSIGFNNIYADVVVIDTTNTGTTLGALYDGHDYPLVSTSNLIPAYFNLEGDSYSDTANAGWTFQQTTRSGTAGQHIALRFMSNAATIHLWSPEKANKWILEVAGVLGSLVTQTNGSAGLMAPTSFTTGQAGGGAMVEMILHFVVSADTGPAQMAVIRAIGGTIQTSTLTRRRVLAFEGNSITNNIGLRWDQNYPFKVCQANGYAELNVAVGGSLLTDDGVNMVDLIASLAVTLGTPEKIVVLHGTNDYDYALTDVQTPLVDFTAACGDVAAEYGTALAAVPVFVVPLLRRTAHLQSPDNIQAYRDAQVSEMDGVGTITVLTQTPYVSGFNTALLGDGIHPTEAGNDYLAGQIADDIGLFTLPAPTHFTNTSPGGSDFIWDDMGSSNYTLYRNTDGGAFFAIQTMIATTHTTDGTGTSGHYYRYKLTQTQDGTESDFSDVVLNPATLSLTLTRSGADVHGLIVALTGATKYRWSTDNVTFTDTDNSGADLTFTAANTGAGVTIYVIAKDAGSAIIGRGGAVVSGGGSASSVSQLLALEVL